MIILGAIALVVLVGSAGLVAWLAVGGLPMSWLAGLTTWWGRAVLGLCAVTFLGAGFPIIRVVSEHNAFRHSVRRPGPKGELIISLRAIRELASALLAQQLGLSGFRIALHPGADGVYIKVILRLPSEEEAPRLAERIQELLSREIQSKTGIPVHEINLAVRRTATRPEASSSPPSEPVE